MGRLARLLVIILSLPLYSAVAEDVTAEQIATQTGKVKSAKEALNTAVGELANPSKALTDALKPAQDLLAKPALPADQRGRIDAALAVLKANADLGSSVPGPAAIAQLRNLLSAAQALDQALGSTDLKAAGAAGNAALVGLTAANAAADAGLKPKLADAKKRLGEADVQAEEAAKFRTTAKQTADAEVDVAEKTELTNKIGELDKEITALESARSSAKLKVASAEQALTSTQTLLDAKGDPGASLQAYVAAAQALPGRIATSLLDVLAETKGVPGLRARYGHLLDGLTNLPTSGSAGAPLHDALVANLPSYQVALLDRPDYEKVWGDLAKVLNKLAERAEKDAEDKIVKSVDHEGIALNEAIARLDQVGPKLAAWLRLDSSYVQTRGLEYVSLADKLLRSPRLYATDAATGAAAGGKLADELDGLLVACRIIQQEMTRQQRPGAEVRSEVLSRIRLLEASTGELRTSLGLIQDALAGDVSQFASGQVQLYYFNDIERLMRLLNPATQQLGGDDRAQLEADDARRQLMTAEADLLEARHALAADRARLAALEDELRQTTSAARFAQSLVDIAVERIGKLERHKKAIVAQSKAEGLSAEDATALADQLKDIQAKIDNETLEKAPLETRSTDAQRAVADIQAEGAALPQKIEAGQRAVETATAAVVLKRRLVFEKAVTESEAFVQARDHQPILFAQAVASSTDPVKRCYLYAFADSRTIFLRGQPSDLAWVKDIIADFDRPQAQAMLTLWTLEMTGQADANKRHLDRFNNALRAVDSLLADRRRMATSAANLLRTCINDKVQSVVDEEQVAATKQTAGEPVPGFEDARPTGPDEPWVPLGPLLTISAAEPGLLQRYWLELADLETEAKRVADALAKGQTPSFNRPANSLFVLGSQQLREAKTATSQLELALQRTTWGNGADDQVSALAVGVADAADAVAERAGRIQAMLVPMSANVSLSATVKDLGDQLGEARDALFALSATIRDAERPQWAEYRNQRQRFLRYRFYDREVVERLSAVPFQAVMNRRQFTVVDRLALPDPAASTTLAEALLVLSLAKRQYQQEVMEDFCRRVDQEFSPTGPLGRDWVVPPARRQGVTETQRRREWFLGLQTALGRGPAVSRAAPGSGLTPAQFEIVTALQRAAVERIERRLHTIAEYYDQVAITPSSNWNASQRSLFDNLAAEAEELMRWLTYEMNILPPPAARRGGMAADPLDDLGALARAIHPDPDDPATWVTYRYAGEGVNARIAAADQMLKEMVLAFEGDVELHFGQPMRQQLRQAIQDNGLNVGIMQQTSVLATNREVARVDPRATATLPVGHEVDALGAAATVAQIYASLTSGNLLGTLGLFGTSAAKPRADELYAITGGSTFQVTPVVDPSGQALQFKFDYVAQTPIREPNGTVNPQLPRIERHTVNTTVQVSSLEIREISRYSANARLGIPATRSGGLPILNDLPIIKDIPLIGWWNKREGKSAFAAESIILAQTTVYPTILELSALLTPGIDLERIDRPESLPALPQPPQQAGVVATDVTGECYAWDRGQGVGLVTVTASGPFAEGRLPFELAACDQGLAKLLSQTYAFANGESPLVETKLVMDVGYDPKSGRLCALRLRDIKGETKTKQPGVLFDWQPVQNGHHGVLQLGDGQSLELRLTCSDQQLSDDLRALLADDVHWKDAKEVQDGHYYTVSVDYLELPTKPREVIAVRPRLLTADATVGKRDDPAAPWPITVKGLEQDKASYQPPAGAPVLAEGDQVKVQYWRTLNGVAIVSAEKPKPAP